jgi:hypothetical protein
MSSNNRQHQDAQPDTYAQATRCTTRLPSSEWRLERSSHQSGRWVDTPSSVTELPLIRGVGEYRPGCERTENHSAGPLASGRRIGGRPHGVSTTSGDHVRGGLA